MQGSCGQHAEPRVVQTFNFREKAKEFADFHNKNQIWKVSEYSFIWTTWCW